MPEKERKKPVNQKIDGLHNPGISKKSSGINYDCGPLQKFATRQKLF